MFTPFKAVIAQQIPDTGFALFTQGSLATSTLDKLDFSTDSASISAAICYTREAGLASVQSSS